MPPESRRASAYARRACLSLPSPPHRPRSSCSWAVGFLVGAIGHVYKSKTLIATGIGLIFMATLGLPLGLYLSDR